MRDERTRYIAVDVNGLILSAICTPANESDDHAGYLLVKELNNKAIFPRLKKILGDKAYLSVGSELTVSV